MEKITVKLRDEVFKKMESYRKNLNREKSSDFTTEETAAALIKIALKDWKGVPS